MEEKFYSVDEAADKIGVHPKTIRRYIFSGKLEALKVGGQWRVYEEAMDKFLKTGTQCNHNHDSGQVSSDDFCVFMDSNYFDSEDPVQICTIVDYYVEEKKDVTPMVNALMEVMHSFDDESSASRFNYVYDRADKKARFVFWGCPTMIEKMVGALKPFEKGRR